MDKARKHKRFFGNMSVFSCLFLLSACATPRIAQRELPLPTSGPLVVSTRENLEDFWIRAKDQTDRNKESLFNSLVIRPHQEAYNNLALINSS